MFFIHAEVRSCISGESFRNMWISWLRLDFGAWAHQRLWTSTVCNIAKAATMWNKYYHSFDFKQPASRNWRHNKQVTTADFEQPPWSILNFRFCCHWFDVPLRPSPLISMLRRQSCFTFFLRALFWPRADPTLNSGGGGGARNLRLSIDHRQTSNLKTWIQNREQQCYNWPIWVGAAWLKQD